MFRFYSLLAWSPVEFSILYKIDIYIDIGALKMLPVAT